MWHRHSTSNRLAKCVGLAMVAILGLWASRHLRVFGQRISPDLDDFHGTIYFWQEDAEDARLWQVNADGSSKRRLPSSVRGEPSRYLHTTHRWFITIREVENLCNPDGSPGRGMFAIRDDERCVQLALQPDLEPMPLTPRWLPHKADRTISWIARRWSPAGEPLEGGIYAASLIVSGDGELLGLETVPESPLVALNMIHCPDGSTWRNAMVPDIQSHDWSPDGGFIVYDSTDAQLHVRNLATGNDTLLTTTPGMDPVWSPDGKLIAFKSAGPLGGIATLAPNGTNLKSVIRCTDSRLFVVAQPLWSPDCIHLAFLRAGCATKTDVASPLPFDVFLARADGNCQINITGDIACRVKPIAWR